MSISNLWKQSTPIITGREQYDLTLIQNAAIGSGEDKGFVTTTDVAQYFGSTVDATGKRLHRLADLGFVVRKKKGIGRAARYQWRISAKGRKVTAR